MPWPPAPRLPVIRIQPLSRGLPSFASFRLPAGERLPSSAHQGPVHLPSCPGAPQDLRAVVVPPKLLHLATRSGGLQEETPPGTWRDQIGVVGSSSPPGTCQKHPAGKGDCRHVALLLNNERLSDLGPQWPGGEQSWCGQGSASCGCAAGTMSGWPSYSNSNL